MKIQCNHCKNLFVDEDIFNYSIAIKEEKDQEDRSYKYNLCPCCAANHDITLDEFIGKYIGG